MSRAPFNEAIQDGQGNALEGIYVHVYLAGTTTDAAIYSARSGGGKANPFLTGPDGMATFWADTGDYDVKCEDSQVPVRVGTKTYAFVAAPSGNGSIPYIMLGDKSIPQTKLGLLSVGAPEIIDGAVVRAKIGADAVDGTKIADSSINTEHVVNGSVSPQKLALGTVVRDVGDAQTTNPANTWITACQLTLPEAGRWLVWASMTVGYSGGSNYTLITGARLVLFPYQIGRSQGQWKTAGAYSSVFLDEYDMTEVMDVTAGADVYWQGMTNVALASIVSGATLNALRIG